jgi:magnesium chelatase subunit D
MIDQSKGKSASGVRGGAPEFTGIVGQAEFKEALLAVAANGALDGLLIRGEKGTAKSTAVRALADLLPVQAVIEGCPYGCPPGAAERQCSECRTRTDPPTVDRRVPLVTVPLGATRERVVGTLSVADALAGEYEFDPGLLARSNRGILYVDEVNLLDDHLVDVLLDAAASGVNRVERDGVSLTHPADFTLVGSMNPEEGDLRPQLRDRFALQTTVTGCAEIDQRVAIIEGALGTGGSAPATTATTATTAGSGDERGGNRRGDEAAADSGHEQNTAATGERAPSARLCRARERLDEVDLPGDLLEKIARLCRDVGVEGHRGDIATARASRTLAALDGRPRVLESDVRRAAELALSHRLQSRPFEDTPDPEDVIDEQFDDRETAGGEAEASDDDSEGRRGNGGGSNEREKREGSGGNEDGKAGGDRNTVEDRSGADDTGDEDDTDSPGSSERVEEGTEADDSDGSGSDPSPSSGDERGGADVEASEGGDDSSENDGGDGNERGDGSDEDDNSTGATPLIPGGSAATVGEGRAPDLSAPDAVGDERGSDAESGSRSCAHPDVTGDGPRVRTERAERTEATDRIDAAASIRSASARGASTVESRDLRRSVRRREASSLVLFVVDASASMRPAMRAAKGVVLELLKDAYRERDEVGFVAFAGDDGEVLLPPTDSVTLAARHLKDLPTGDRTPLPAGLDTASAVLERADPATSIAAVVTDGRANVAEGSPVEETRAAARRLGTVASHTMVVDAGDEGDRIGLAGLVARETGGERVPLAALSAERVDATIGAAREI